MSGESERYYAACGTRTGAAPFKVRVETDGLKSRSKRSRDSLSLCLFLCDM